MFDGQSASEALKRIDEWERSLARRAEQAQELARRTAGLTATVRSRDGLVEVTVGAEGRVERLHGGRFRVHAPLIALSKAAETTARSVLETLREAEASLVKQFEEATAETVGVETETGRMLLAGLRKRLGQPDE